MALALGNFRCGAKAANELDAFIARRPVNCIPNSLDRYRRTVEPVRWVMWISANGWCTTVLLSTSQNIRKENTARSSARPSTPNVVFGQAAMSSLGYTGYASEPAEARPTAQTTRTHTRESWKLCATFIHHEPGRHRGMRRRPWSGRRQMTR